MITYVLRRLLAAVPTLLVVSVIVFCLLHALPADPAEQILGDGATPQALAAVRLSYGLNASLPVQYFSWLKHVLQGDLGVSLLNQEPVARLILARFKLSALIVVLAITFSALLAIPLGLAAGRWQNRAPDVFIVSVSTLLLSIPSFWLGILLLLLFGVHWHWLPVVGYVSLQQDFLAGLKFLVLPVLTLGLIQFGSFARMMRASTIEVLRLEYVTHARATGLSGRTVMWRHVFPNAFGPTWTLIGLSLGNLLGGIAVIETVFTLPGLGRLLVDSIFARDYPVVQGCLLLTALSYVLVNLAVDLTYPLFDPKISA